MSPPRREVTLAARSPDPSLQSPLVRRCTVVSAFTVTHTEGRDEITCLVAAVPSDPGPRGRGAVLRRAWLPHGGVRPGRGRRARELRGRDAALAHGPLDAAREAVGAARERGVLDRLRGGLGA